MAWTCGLQLINSLSDLYKEYVSLLSCKWGCPRVGLGWFWTQLELDPPALGGGAEEHEIDHLKNRSSRFRVR